MFSERDLNLLHCPNPILCRNQYPGLSPQPCRFFVDKLLFYCLGPAVELLVQPSRSTVGERLLMRQGWKPGQGIGPKVPRTARADRTRSYQQTYGPTGAPAFTTVSRLFANFQFTVFEM